MPKQVRHDTFKENRLFSFRIRLIWTALLKSKLFSIGDYGIVFEGHRKRLPRPLRGLAMTELRGRNDFPGEREDFKEED